MNNTIETLVNVFTIENGSIKTLLMRKKTEPYKGYWIIPSNNVSETETLEEVADFILIEKLGLRKLELEQYYTFSKVDRYPTRTFSTGFIGTIDNITVKLRQEEVQGVEYSWFKIDSLPKLGYDHNEIIEKAIAVLKKRILNSNVIKTFFPSDFTLPEVQKVYELVLNKELDRRNFRKKFINLGLVEDTGDKNEGFNGRPAKLYRFKENLEERELF